MTPLIWVVLLVCALAPAARAQDKDPILPEDFIATAEPGHPEYWGIDWSVNNFLLPYRALQRGKHELESRWAGNWRFAGGAGGVFLRLIVGVGADFGLFMAPQNIHHQTGHDAAAREFDRAFGDGRSVPRALRQMLPNYLGGGTLATVDRQPVGRGADANAKANVQPMESETVFAYEQGKQNLSGDLVDSIAIERFLFFRGRFLMDWTEMGTLDQTYLDNRDLGGPAPGSRLSTDFTQYLYAVNTDRYGQKRVSDFRVTMGDLKLAYLVQALDPLMWTSLYAWGRDYLGRGRNTTTVPMIPLGADWEYLPGLRVFFSPFGMEFFQDNYFRRGSVLVNVNWMSGDNAYESRGGGGVDVEGLQGPGRLKLGAYLQLARQPLLSRLTSQTTLSGNPLRPGEAGRGHVAYDIGGSLQLPVWAFEEGADPRRLFIYVRAGTKNLAWFPGRYLSAGTYLQTGIGLRL